MLQKPQECVGCALHSIGKGFSRPEGTCANGVLIVGEALGEQEARDGLPFRPGAPAGHVLEMAIKSLGFTREAFATFNVCACNPPRNELLGMPYEYGALNHCKVHLRKVVEQYHPRVILACGAIPTRVLTGLTGKKLRMEDIQGFALECPDYPGVRVIPTYHPSYIQRGAWQVYPVLRLALARAVQLAKTGWKEPVLEYKTDDCTPEDVWSMKEVLDANPDMPLAFDFETDGGKIEPDVLTLEDDEEDEEEHSKKKGPISTDARITQVNLSIKDGTGIALDFNHESRAAVAAILATPNMKIGFNNWCYDQPVAKFNGLVINGTSEDGMALFHHVYPDLPGSYKKLAGDNAKEQGSYAGLQFCASFYGFPFPWKHMNNERPLWYGVCDSDATLRVYNGAKRDAIKMGVWEGYVQFMRRLRPILADAERRGIPASREKLTKFVEMMRIRETQELAKLAPMIPEELCVPKQTMGLKREPKDTTGLVKRRFFLLEPEPCVCVTKTHTKKCKECKGTGGVVNRSDEVVDCPICSGAGVLMGSVTPKEGCLVCGGKGVVKGEVERWCAIKPFNANSHVQLRNYATYEGPTPLGFKRKHTIPKNSKRESAMDHETLEKLLKTYKDPVYEVVMNVKSMNKLISTYGVGWLSRLSPVDECIHTQFLFLPATGQISSNGPNVQNAIHPIKHGAMAQLWREAIEAKPGHVFIEADYRSYHSQTLAIEAKDADFLRLAKLDIHSYLTGQFLKLEGYNQALGWDDQKLKAWLKDIKKKYERVRNMQAKPCIAEGQLVLTDQGLVPIEQVTTLQKLWDGVEWVSHDGVVCKGVKGVITHEGLTATPDHQVFCEDGILRCLRAVASAKSTRIIRSGNQKTPVRIMDCHGGHRKEEGLSLSDLHLSVRLSERRKKGMSSHEQVRLLQMRRALRQRQVHVSRTRCFGRTFRQCIRQVQQSESSGLVQLWRARNRATIYSKGVHQVCIKKPTSFNLRGIGSGSNQQRRSLRTRESSLSDTITTDAQHTLHGVRGLQRKEDTVCRFQMSVSSDICKQTGEARFDGRADSSAEEVETHHEAKVYDIVNAGPRHRFTVSNVLVANCTLGFGFGLGASRLYRANQEHFANEKEAQRMFDALNSAFPKAAQYREDAPELAHKQRFLRSPYGCIRWFWNVKGWDARTKSWGRGTDWDKAIAFRPANNAFCHKKLAMLRMEEAGLMERYGFSNDLHDCLFFHCPVEHADECIHTVKTEMERPSEVMLMNDGRGLSVEVEIKRGVNWGAMEEVKA